MFIVSSLAKKICYCSCESDSFQHYFFLCSWSLVRFSISVYSYFFPLLSLSAASVCFAVCLLSLAWALVLYARACSLIRPGHLQMTPAAILCRLLWRVGVFDNFPTISIYDTVSNSISNGATSVSVSVLWLFFLQVGMLGSRCAILMLFARIFNQWVLGVIGKSGFQGYAHFQGHIFILWELF